MWARKRVAWFLAGAALVLALIVVALALRNEPVAVDSALAEARARWAGRAFSDYQITLLRNTNGVICQQEIEAQDEQVTRVISNACGQPATWTVSRLHDWIGQLEQTPSRCFPGPGFCACQAAPRTVVNYHPELGYPTEILYEWSMGPNWANADYWRSLLDQAFPGCSRQGFGGPLVVNVRLAPGP